MNRYKILIVFVVVILLLTVISIAADLHNKDNTSVNGTASKSNPTIDPAEKINETNESAGPVSISLEKPPFIE